MAGGPCMPQRHLCVRQHANSLCWGRCHCCPTTINFACCSLPRAGHHASSPHQQHWRGTRFVDHQRRGWRRGRRGRRGQGTNLAVAVTVELYSTRRCVGGQRRLLCRRKPPDRQRVQGRVGVGGRHQPTDVGAEEDCLAILHTGNKQRVGGLKNR